ncbi:hypothetical protein [Priestia flexa]|uniref:hypothetical protein n=1 Tax=Priestia flexa TaxID=86664 RepID=UPI001C9889A9|nr:hypothetical protein [Priestia flexa]MBY6088063.1 hypothetical protein [Priestia flexa]
MEWIVGHSTPAGKRGKTEIPQRSEEAQVPPCGKRVAVAQWNERVLTNQRDENSECSSFRSNHFVMSQTLFLILFLFFSVNGCFFRRAFVTIFTFLTLLFRIFCSSF